MSYSKLKPGVSIGLILIFLTILTISYSPSFAEDSVETLENTTSDLQNELSDLNNELANLSAELNSIMAKMELITGEIEQTKFDLADAKTKQEAQHSAMKARIVYIYEHGNTSILEVLLSSASMADFLNKIEFVSKVSEYDRQLLEQLTEAKNIVAQKEEDLEKEQATLAALKDELDEKEKSLSSKISSASGELAQYTAQLAEAKERARAAQEALAKKVEPTPPKKEEPEEPPVMPPQNDTSSEPNPPIIAAPSDVELLAALIECEAGSKNYDGMLAIGSVVINRVNHRSYPDSIQGVIYQSGQFTPVSSGKLDIVLNRGVKSPCVKAAQDAISGKNNIGGCLNFRAESSGHTGIVIGGNVFF